MQHQYRTQGVNEQALIAVDRAVAKHLVERLDQFLAPLLVVLDAYVDTRLVRTVLALVVSLVQLRHREAGVVLSE
jgi:site-specific recombinase